MLRCLLDELHPRGQSELGVDVGEVAPDSPRRDEQTPEARTPMTVGLAHSAYTFPDLKSLLTKHAELKKAGIAPRVPVQHGPTTSLYYRDPDGNTVELQVDNFETAEAATEYMRGPEFASDPFGPTFDPDAMFAALRAGTPESELLTRAWAMTCAQRNVPERLLT